MTGAIEISVVIPTYGCADCLRALHERLCKAIEPLTPDFELVFVDDRSPDESWNVLQEIAASDNRVRVFRLSRNFGQHAAITAGLAESRGRWVVVMDCDLQDPPEDIPRLYAKAHEGYDVVLSHRRERVQSLARRFTAGAYFRLHNVVASSEKNMNYTNLSILARKVVDGFLKLGDKDRQYLLIVHWLGYKRAEIEVSQSPRHAGRSSYRFSQLVRVAVDGIFFQSTALLRWIVYSGFGLAFLGALLAAYTGVVFLLGRTLPQWTAIPMLILFLTGFIIISTGVTGLYVGKIFEQVKGRPLYVIDTCMIDGRVDAYEQWRSATPATRTPRNVERPKVATRAGRWALTFNRPYATGNEFDYIQQAIDGRHLSGNGPFTARCANWLEENIGSARAMLTPSCTSALELAAILSDIGPGDEVILPSFTFVSTASAIALRGGTPVFVDISPDTLTLDPDAVASAVTPNTKGVMPVHYAGVASDMDAICEIADGRGLFVIEDAAQCVLASYKGKPLGGIGALGCISFHETKNVTSGEGGALLVNRPDLIERAEIVQEKGTNRAKFFRGQVDKYTWVDLGSSFLTSDVNAAFLWAQLEQVEEITDHRRSVWNAYHTAFSQLEAGGKLRRPVIPESCVHNAHMYYILLPSRAERDRVISTLAGRAIQAVFHYVPLHSSPAGMRYGRASGSLAVTERVSDTLVRLPLWVGMTDADVGTVVAGVEQALA